MGLGRLKCMTVTDLYLLNAKSGLLSDTEKPILVNSVPLTSLTCTPEMDDLVLGCKCSTAHQSRILSLENMCAQEWERLRRLQKWDERY